MKKTFLLTTLLFCTGTALADSNFNFSNVEQAAKDLAKHPYAAPKNDLPQELANLDYDTYGQIQYKTEKSMWANEKLPFALQFFHRGYLYKDRIAVNIVTNGKVTPVEYSPDQFNFGNDKFSQPLKSDLGFAGFRIRYAYPNTKEPYTEVAVFLGASYFRAVGLNQQFGLSARALAIDTGLAKPEEFPAFREYWIEKPQPGAKTLTFYGLLDSPSVAGAYKFVLHPGSNLTFDVSNHLYFRNAVQRLGIAPITSMFLTGKNRENFIDDYRQEVHDSDGLLVKRTTGEWIWRPLINPKQLGLSIIGEKTLGGFGLFQRERRSDQYQDFLGFESRPSLWVQPLDHWNPGSIYLIEIPSDAEKYDNIAAFWVPDEKPGAGKEYQFKYRLNFTLADFAENNLAKVISTRIGAGGPDGMDHSVRRFVLDFKGSALQNLSKDKIEPVISASAGTIQNTYMLQSPDKKYWRLVFELAPNGNPGPIEMRTYLKSGDKAISETWLYQWHAA